MPENEIGNPEIIDEVPTPRRRRLSRRSVGISAAAVAIGGVVFVGALLVAYWFGFVDRYVKNEFTTRMSEIGVVFDADKFKLIASPFELHLVNATFNDRVSGEKLFFVKDARLGLSVQDVLAWQLTRDIRIDTTDIDGAEVWVKFDENGRSNFSNLTLVEEKGGVINFRYDTVIFSLRNGVVHAGNVTRKISGDANNVTLSIEPESASADSKRYKFGLTSTESRFVYDDRPLEPIDIRARGIAYADGAEITELHIETPIGIADLNGTITDWASLKYDLNIESNVDLTQASNVFSLGATLRGVGNFKGNIKGEGETYRIEGSADAQSLAADGVYLKGINIEGTVAGTNANYEANGNAIAELLTFKDFRIEFPRLVGNVRGTGTDFRWVGELQAAALRSGSLTLGGLFLRDAVAEMNDRELVLNAGSGRSQKFSVGGSDFDVISARNMKLSVKGDEISISAPNARADSLRRRNLRLDGINGSDLTVKTANKRSKVDIKRLTSRSARIGDNQLRDLSADSFSLTNSPGDTDISLLNARAAIVERAGTLISGVESPSIAIIDRPADTKIFADSLRVASIVGGGIELGSLNIAGVRLKIREGRIDGSSNDIDAGTIAILKSSAVPNGGSLSEVVLVEPVFVVEASGRYRASADMSIGGGIIGSIPLGDATAKLSVDNDRLEFGELDARVMQGSIKGRAAIALNSKTESRLAADFENLDLAKVLALQINRILPIEGRTSGRADLTFLGTELTTASGTLKAEISANAGSAEQGLVPITGLIDLTASNGLFNIAEAKLNSENSELIAQGRFDLRAEDSDLQVSLRSTDASEVDRLIRVFGVSPDTAGQLDAMQAQFAGDFAFQGNIKGNLGDPIVSGKASVHSVLLRGRDIGSVETALNISPTGVNLRNGRLDDRQGGSADFTVDVPYGGINNTTVEATLRGINAGNLIVALPFELPDGLRDLEGKTSGTVALSGLPNESQGSIDLTTEAGSLSGHSFDTLMARADFQGTRITLSSMKVRVGNGTLDVGGTYDRADGSFDLKAESKAMPLPLVLSFLPKYASMPQFSGVVDLVAMGTGNFGRTQTYDINFEGRARDVVINETAYGVIIFNGDTVNNILGAELTATFEGRPQPIKATLDLANPDLPLWVETTLDQSPLGPFFALVPQLRGIQIVGTGTGQLDFGGNLTQLDSNGNRVFSSNALSGTARLRGLALRVRDTPIAATEPVLIRFSPNEVMFESAKFSGSGSNVTISGTKAISGSVRNDLSIEGRINLALLNVLRPIQTSDTFFGGLADVSVRLTGTNAELELLGSATTENGSIAAFIGTDRFTFDRLNGRVLFTSNQAQIERMSGNLGGGQFTATGGVLLADDLSVNSYRLSLNGNNITIPYPKDFITTGDAFIDVAGRRVDGVLTMLVTGSINARRSLYSKDIDLATVVGARREGSISGSGTSSISSPEFDLYIEGRNALVVQNNLADLTASVSLRITGNAENPQIVGRIVANGGQVFFRRDRYDVQRGVLEFPPNTEFEPNIFLQAETQIGGYQIFVNLSGPLNDTELLSATVRSSPALPQADVISLITTGGLSNTETGIPTLAQTGINTAAEVLTDSIINNPVRKATDRLFGLNVFEIDPIISGERSNPVARLTVGRQINNNLRVTYSTNLSQDQNQVLAFEYRVSNNFSFVAQYEQRSLSNVTRSRDNFSFGVRLRRRF